LFDGDDDVDDYGAEAKPQPEEVQQEVEEPVQEEQPPAVQTVEQVEEFVYYDPVKKVKFSFDPITLEAKIEEENVDWES
jgi:hypothetical protein